MRCVLGPPARGLGPALVARGAGPPRRRGRGQRARERLSGALSGSAASTSMAATELPERDACAAQGAELGTPATLGEAHLRAFGQVPAALTVVPDRFVASRRTREPPPMRCAASSP
jgi:hypothetical protein